VITVLANAAIRGAKPPQPAKDLKRAGLN